MNMRTYFRKNSNYIKKIFITSNFDETCRLCLSEDVNDLFPLFATENVQYQEWIKYSVDISVEEGDGLPPNICQSCLTLLEQAYLFKRKCNLSDVKLKEHLKRINHEEEQKANNLYMNCEADETTTTVQPTPSEPDKSGEGNNETVTEEETTETNQENRQCMNVNVDNVGENTNDCIDTQNLQTGTADEDLNGDEPALTMENCVTTKHTEQPVKFSKNMHLVEEINQLWEKDSEEEEEEEEEIENEVEERVCEGKVEVHHQVVIEEDGECEIEVEEAPVLWQTQKVTDREDHIEIEVEVDENEVVVKEMKRERRDMMCDLCGQAFSSLDNVMSHARSHHSVMGGRWCPLCNKKFACKQTLERHMIVHSGERPYKCPVCKRAFNQSIILKRHMYVHQKEKPFKCPLCVKSYTQRENLQQHMRSHGFVRDNLIYPCKLCGKHFRHSSGLSRHMLSHKGKKFNCNICNKAYTDPSTLRRHVKAWHTKKRNVQ